MSEVHILGHCNATLSHVVDALGASSKDLSRITVVSNVPINDDTPWIPHPSFEIRVYEITSDEWNGKFKSVILGVYKPGTKRIVFETFYQSHGIDKSDYSCLFHPSTVISPQTNFGFGVYLAAGTIVSPYVSIGDQVTVNRNTSVGHHTEIAEFTSINPGCTIASKCRIGANVTIGIGATILDGLSVGNNTVIGAGSVVTRSIPDDVVAWGIPAKVVKQRGD